MWDMDQWWTNTVLMWINGVYVGIFRFRGIYIYIYIILYMGYIWYIYIYIYIYMGYSMGKSSWEYGTSNPQDLVLRVCLMVSLDGFSAVKMGRRSPVTQKLIFFRLDNSNQGWGMENQSFYQDRMGIYWDIYIYIIYTYTKQYDGHHIKDRWRVVE